MDLNKKLKELKPQQLNCNVFDVYSYNGLSMQDLLCQFFTKINECIHTSNETIDLAKWLVNEGLELEVVKKLMIWLEDGTLENIINVNLFNTLNSKINGLSSQLEQNTTKVNEQFNVIESRNSTLEENFQNSSYERGCVVSIIDDDCMPTFISKMKTTLENNNVKCSLALPTSQIGMNGTMNLSQLQSLEGEGYEILSHGHGKILTSVSETEMINDLKTSKEKMKEYGFKNTEILVYNGGNWNNETGRTVKKNVRKYYKYAFNNFGDNNLIVDNLMIGRLDFNTKTIEDIKTEIDKAIKNKSYLCLMTHSWQDTFDISKLDETIKYIKSKGIDIVKASEGVKLKCNHIDFGERALTGHTCINANGQMTSNFFSLDANTINREIYDYPLGVSYIDLPTYVAGITPQPSGLKDYTWSGYSSFITVVKSSLTTCTQYLTLNYTKKLQYCRTWDDSNSKWSEFKPMFSYINIGAVANTDIKKNISNYDANVITEFYCAGGSNTPNSKPCMIQVHRFNDDAYSYMECIPHDESKKYRSKWNNGTKTWGEWLLY